MAGGQRVGYIRVSSIGQNPRRQLDGVEADRVFTDTVSGKDTRRPQLAALLTFVRDGDTVVVHSMDRLALYQYLSPPSPVSSQAPGLPSPIPG